MRRSPSHALPLMAAAFALFLAAPGHAEVEDNVEGLGDLRREIMTKVRSGQLHTAGPWNLRYVGPLPPGAQVFLTAEPRAAFKTTLTRTDGYEVKLQNHTKLFTRVTGELRPIGITIRKTYESPGEGRVYVTFQTKDGKMLDLESLEKKGMIQALVWSDKEAARFVGYVGKEAAFLRSEGHANTQIVVRLTVKEEGDVFTFSEWLPRTGPNDGRTVHSLEAATLE